MSCSLLAAPVVDVNERDRVRPSRERTACCTSRAQNNALRLLVCLPLPSFSSVPSTLCAQPRPTCSSYPPSSLFCSSPCQKLSTPTLASPSTPTSISSHLVSMTRTTPLASKTLGQVVSVPVVVPCRTQLCCLPASSLEGVVTLWRDWRLYLAIGGRLTAFGCHTLYRGSNTAAKVLVGDCIAQFSPALWRARWATVRQSAISSRFVIHRLAC